MTWPSQQDLTSFDTGLGVGQEWSGEGGGAALTHLLSLQVSHLISSSTLVVGRVRLGRPHTQQWSGCFRSGVGVWRRAAAWTGPLRSRLPLALCSYKVRRGLTH